MGRHRSSRPAPSTLTGDADCERADRDRVIRWWNNIHLVEAAQADPCQKPCRLLQLQATSSQGALRKDVRTRLHY